VHFGLDLIAVSDPSQANFANAPSGNSAMGVGGAGGDYAMTVAAGFNLLSFFYSATDNTSVTVSFLNGTAQVFSLLANDGACTNGPAFCMWSLANLDLGGQIATGIDFGATSGVAAFDNVDVNPVPLPAAGWLLMTGLGFLGALRRKRAA
jgi:hypothetical protein